MTTTYTVEQANALLPDLARVAARLRDQRADLVRLRDACAARLGDLGLPSADVARGGEDDAGLRTLRLRMQGIVDQMQADVAWLDARGIALRDIPTGLVDLPGRVEGRAAWLCWRLGEPDVAWWHHLDAGFAARRPLPGPEA